MGWYSCVSVIAFVETGCFNMGWCSVIVTDVVGVG